jgi:putative phage-type endonuclease
MNQYKLVTMDQSGSEWLEWRRQGVGGSDSAVIMGCNPWCKPSELRQKKIGEAQEEYENERMARGKRLEPIVRQMYEELTGLQMTPVCVEHIQFPWFRASLDGLSECGNVILEIKCPNDRAHSEALRGWVPKYYYPQLQHQLGVTGAKIAHYVSYSDAPKFKPHERICLVEMLPNTGYIKELIVREAEFVQSCKNQTVGPM